MQRQQYHSFFGLSVQQSKIAQKLFDRYQTPRDSDEAKRTPMNSQSSCPLYRKLDQDFVS